MPLFLGTGWRGFQAEVVRAIHALLPVDAVFIATADPETLLLTSIVAEEPLAHVADQFLDNEFGQDDVNKFQSLVTGARHVATLDSATHGDRAGSARYREIMTPLAWRRAPCRTGYPIRVLGLRVPASGRVAVRVHAGRGAPHQPARDQHRQWLPAKPRGPRDRGDRCHCSWGRRTSSRPHGGRQAECLLAEIADYSANSGRLPAAVYAAAACLQNIDSGMVLPDALPTVRVRTAMGKWLLVHATHLHGSAAGDIAVIIEPAHPNRSAPLVLRAHGLTPRECDVALLVLRGASTKAIGAELHLSPYTVKDHIKAIFDKTAVRSRRDLVAHIMTGSAPH